MKKLVRLACLLLVALGMGACSTIRGNPPRYAGAQEVVAAIDLQPQDLAELVSASDRDERNGVQNRAIAVIDLQFNQFVRDLAADRSDASAAAAGATLAASTAGAFVDSVAAKTNYALFAAAVVGAFGIVDRSYFYEKTVPAIVAAMGSARASVLLRMRKAQAEPIGSYDGSAALRDLEDYYAAGTILAAIANLTASAETERQATLEKVRALDVPDDAEIALRKQITSATFSIKDKDSMDKGNQALKTLGLPPGATPKETGLALRRAMRPPTQDRLDGVAKALRSAGLMK